MSTENVIWRQPLFRTYMGSTGFSGMALAMQQLMLSWVLIGIMERPADEVGIIQAIIGIPSIFLMLLGGAQSDSRGPRDLLMLVYLLSPIFPIFLFIVDAGFGLAIWSVMIWGLGVSVVQALSLPAQQAILNEISGSSVQQGVTVATVIGMVVQVVGLLLAGQMEIVGIGTVLVIQAVSFGLAAITIRRLPSLSVAAPPSGVSAWQQIVEGLRATRADSVISSTLTINCISSIFNAGSMMTVFPYIVKRVYEGDALILSLLMALFFVFAAISNAILLRFMPLKRPGRLYLILQLSRVVIITLLYIKGDWWLLTIAVMLWGLNMGLTSNLARTVVQESAEAEYRGRILSVFSVTMMGSAPVGALVLGFLIEIFGTLNALLPAVFVSLALALALYGSLRTPLWRYESPKS
ncbi:MAG: MFS transporter [Pseudomonadales bacterium]|nr:MFS transporter [Pseudomonadales bacterium]